jgi:hypothetical protein
MVWGYSSVVQYLASMCKTLVSILTTEKERIFHVWKANVRYSEDPIMWENLSIYYWVIISTSSLPTHPLLEEN